VSGSDDPYVYLGTRILQNLLDIPNPLVLDRTERFVVAQRISEGVPDGAFEPGIPSILRGLMGRAGSRHRQ
jgi:hypothetical protein